MDVVFLPLMKQNAELRLTYQACDLFGGGEASSQKRRQSGGIQRVGETLASDQMTIFVHQKGTLSLRILDQLVQNPLYLFDFLFVDYQIFLSQFGTSGLPI
jgi:hypothetical protein